MGTANISDGGNVVDGVQCPGRQAAFSEGRQQECEKYLPRLDSQSEEEYAAYKARASFFGATARTLEEGNGVSPQKTVRVRRFMKQLATRSSGRSRPQT